MNIDELGRLMVEHGVCIRAIPRTVRTIVDVRHIDKYPDGKIVYLPEYKREMLVYEYVPKHAGQFLVKTCRHTMAKVDFNNLKFYDTLEEAVSAMVETGGKIDNG